MPSASNATGPVTSVVGSTSPSEFLSKPRLYVPDVALMRTVCFSFWPPVAFLVTVTVGLLPVRLEVAEMREVTALPLSVPRNSTS